ncbi:hypothetical protein [Phenylobacterium sp. J367]|uniref:hypothetical protein n=1 Tax=Phenylobacterium sp. J367 TaxID=2898435 RepID=UPI002151B2F7|nr:hypothetical protein [Phenylobacterium sp. J367]MCR5879579.1 hypothetical protein [Phenylobacterium sp. J367]
MPWPPRQPPRSEIRPEDLEAYESVIERARTHGGAADPEKDAGYYGRMLLAPRLSNHMSEMGRIFRALGDRGDSYSHADREFVDQVLAADFKTNIVAKMHINDALSTGVRMEAIEALRYGREEALTDDEAFLAMFIRKTIAGAMDAPTWERMEARIGERGTLEYAMFVLFLQATMRSIAMVGNREPSDAEIDQIIADLKSGKTPIDDYRKRIS